MNLHENGLCDIILKQITPMPQISIHLDDEVIVADGRVSAICTLLAWLALAHAAHQLINLVIAETNFECVKSEAELLPSD